MKTVKILFALSLLLIALSCSRVRTAEQDGACVIYSYEPSLSDIRDSLLTDGAGEYVGDGFLVNVPGRRVKLNRYYALAEREARYLIRPADDAVIRFSASAGDFNCIVDVPSGKLTICSTPTELVADAPFLRGGRDYIVEVSLCYLRSTLRITDAKTGRTAFVTGEEDGVGGCGKGAVKEEYFHVGKHWDHYCFTLLEGKEFLVRKIEVLSLKDNVNAIIYGASISQPEGYFPKATFDRAWTQQVINHMGGNAMSSGRGGCNIDDVLIYIQNEIPFIKTKYVIVSIGTNGGNTEEKLNRLIDIIEATGAIPVLNNVPSNEHNSQVEINKMIAKVREERGLIGARFDLGTSLAGDGLEVDKSLMFWEDYTDYPYPLTGWQIYHHPNELGGDAMFRQTLLDIPEIYE